MSSGREGIMSSLLFTNRLMFLANNEAGKGVLVQQD